MKSRMNEFTRRGCSRMIQWSPCAPRRTCRSETNFSISCRLPVGRATSFSPQMTNVGILTWSEPSWSKHSPHEVVQIRKCTALIWRPARSAARTSAHDWKFGLGAAYRRHWVAWVYARAYLPLDRYGERRSHLRLPDDT